MPEETPTGTKFPEIPVPARPSSQGSGNSRASKTAEPEKAGRNAKKPGRRKATRSNSSKGGDPKLDAIEALIGSKRFILTYEDAEGTVQVMTTWA